MSDYFKVKAINNTSLGYIDLENGGSLQKFKDFIDGTLPEEEEKEYRKTGSMVHLYTLEPDKFKVADVERPSDVIVTIVDEVFAAAKEMSQEFGDAPIGTLDSYSGAILDKVVEYNYYANLKEDTRVKKVIEAGTPYFDYLVQRDTTDQILITSKEFATVMSCSVSLKNDKYLQKTLFAEELPEGVEILREYEIYFEVGGHKCKAKLDLLVLNHNKKTFMIIDLKTTGKPVTSFNESFVRFDYKRQFGFYEIAVEAQYPGYTPADVHLCAVVETFGYYRARVFQVPRTVTVVGMTKVYTLLNLISESMETGNWVIEPEYEAEPYLISLT